MGVPTWRGVREGSGQGVLGMEMQKRVLVWRDRRTRRVVAALGLAILFPPHEFEPCYSRCLAPDPLNAGVVSRKQGKGAPGNVPPVSWPRGQALLIRWGMYLKDEVDLILLSF